ncbi:unnamed protein product [Periconia digitata]|uniref:Threonine/serine exporter-like N-terminal domain-containing protein n=1 Tax=Periconia digitata TaxID=1303443 RepID=A0A9W4U409_9PLEO|nr:unnamed protein product [Periconia digitata]
MSKELHHAFRGGSNFWACETKTLRLLGAFPGTGKQWVASLLCYVTNLIPQSCPSLSTLGALHIPFCFLLYSNITSKSNSHFSFFIYCVHQLEFCLPAPSLPIRIHHSLHPVQSAHPNIQTMTSESDHEMKHLQTPSLEPSPILEPPNAERRRVRINSHADTIPRQSSANASHREDVESQFAGIGTSTAEAEELLQAHRSEKPVPEPLEKVTSEEEEEYAYSGNSEGGLLYHLLKAYKAPAMTDASSTASMSPPQYPDTASRPGSSGTMTPRRTNRKWYEQEKGNRSQETLATLIGAAAALTNPNSTPPRPAHKRHSSNPITKMFKAKEDQSAKIKAHLATILKRQQYIFKLARALMLFGAPTHRLEEYLAMTAKILETNAQFLYIPGCILVSYDDTRTKTSEVKMVRVTQGVNLGKLKDTHEIYKEVLHGVIDLDEALARLEEVITAKDRHPVWLSVLMYGLASTAVSCFFKARPIDFPIIFVLGCILGFLQLVVAPLSKTYSTVFEISAAILMTFLSRMFGSIRGGDLFCFSALTQSSIAMILPGWLVLSSSLELQSKAIVPGSIRLVYAIIYSLFLGYGITVGTAIYGAIDSNATSETECRDPMNPYWNFLMVPLYVFFTTFTVQAKYKQMPVMIAIAFAGYVVNFYSNMKFSASAPIAYTFGAFAIGVLANLYSRLRHGVAAAVLLPAVYVQVPGSLAASGSINTALKTASSLIRGGNETVDPNDQQALNAISFNVAASMIQIAIGITVGLFMSALIIYPLGKRRSGLWTL